MAESDSTTGDLPRSVEVSVTPAESVSDAVVMAISDETSTPVEECEPLYDAVNPDALDALCSSFSGDGAVSFAYNGYDVTVTDEETIVLRPRVE